MGWAKIVSGGADGRYLIEIDTGSATKAASLAALSALEARVLTGLATQQAIVDQADADEADVLAELNQAVDDAIADGEPAKALAWTRFYVDKLQTLRARHAPARRALAKFKLDLIDVRKRTAYWNQFEPIEQRYVWCADLTENLPPGRIVATCEVPGDPTLIIIAPGGRFWNPADGYLRGRELSSPAHSFFNAAIFPGWQKHKPTYRVATVTAIDEDANTVNVALAPVFSTAQALDVNLHGSLTSVPVVYMTFHAAAFEVGDSVLVQFVGQSWSSPRVIGFAGQPYGGKFTVRFQVAGGTILAEYKVRKGKDCGGATAPPREQPNPFLGWRHGSARVYTRVHPGVANVTASQFWTAQYAADSHCIVHHNQTACAGYRENRNIVVGTYHPPSNTTLYQWDTVHMQVASRTLYCNFIILPASVAQPFADAVDYPRVITGSKGWVFIQSNSYWLSTPPLAGIQEALCSELSSATWWFPTLDDLGTVVHGSMQIDGKAYVNRYEYTDMLGDRPIYKRVYQDSPAEQ